MDLSPLELDLYLVDELSPEDTARIDEAARHDPALRSWLDRGRLETMGFGDDPRRQPFYSLLRRRKRSSVAKFLQITALAASVAFAVVSAGAWTTHAVRPRGNGLSARVALLRAGEVRELGADERLHAGDRLRLGFDDPRGGYVTVLTEEENSEDVAIAYAAEEVGRTPPGSTILPGSLVLDEATGRERIWVIVTDHKPDPLDWIREIRFARTTDGFDHGWHPDRSARAEKIEYEKVEPEKVAP